MKTAFDKRREQGFLGANETRIAKRVDVSDRTLFKHFENKDALFDAISETMGNSRQLVCRWPAVQRQISRLGCCADTAAQN